MRQHRVWVVACGFALRLGLAVTPIWGISDIYDWEMITTNATFFEAFPKELDNSSKMKSFDRATTYTDRAHGLDLCAVAALACIDSAIIYFCFVRHRSKSSPSVAAPGATP